MPKTKAPPKSAFGILIVAVAALWWYNRRVYVGTFKNPDGPGDVKVYRDRSGWILVADTKTLRAPFKQDTGGGRTIEDKLSSFLGFEV